MSVPIPTQFRASVGVRSRIVVLAAVTSLLGHAGVLIALVMAPLELSRDITERPPSRSLVAFAEIFAEAPSSTGMPRVAAAHRDQSSTIDIEQWKPPAIDAIALDAFDVADEVLSMDDAERVETLQRIYARQLSARLMRSLEEGPRFCASVANCSVSVIEDEFGNVVDVFPTECALSETQWAALTQAIRRASPLPKPPHGLAMGSALNLQLSELVDIGACDAFGSGTLAQLP